MEGKNNKLVKEDKKKLKNKINPLGFQIMLKFKLNNIFTHKVENELFSNQILDIHELSNKRIGIISYFFILIYSLKSFKLLQKIEPDYFKFINLENEGYNSLYYLINFIELKNGDLVLWNERIILIYKLENKKYTLYQTIYEYDQGTRSESYFKTKLVLYYNLNSIYELHNNNLVSCNSYGLKIYHKENNEYILMSTIRTSCDVEKLVEIKPNILILFQRHFTCGHHGGSYSHSVSIYDINNEKETVLTSDYGIYRDLSTINFIIKNNYLFDRYSNYLDIYNIEKNMQKIEKGDDLYMEYDNYTRHNEKFLKDKMKITLLSDYFDNLFLASYHYKIQIFKFENELVQFYCDFPINCKGGIKGIVRLKDDLMILYSYFCLIVIKFI